MCLLLGDGSLGSYKQNGKFYGRFNINHGISQSDYQTWKAQLLSKAFNKDVKLYSGHKGKSIQIQMMDKRFRIWRRFCYKNGKKDIPAILKFVKHPELALATFLMDDGYVEPSITNKKVYGARLRLFICDQTDEQNKLIIEWFKKQFNIEFKLKSAFHKKKNKHYPFLKLGQADSLKVWSIIREFVLGIDSMKYKFRHLEYIYQYKLAQRTLGSNSPATE